MASDELFQDDELIFANEEQSADVAETKPPWKILVVDDEAEVHNVTKMVLGNFQFDGRGLKFLHAYSGAEALEILEKEEEIAMMLLDVVMETDDAGLRVAQQVRGKLTNPFVRIVLRTGQPGQAPEEKVILQYDINDYKSKTELTASKLFTTIVTSLRSYRDIMTIEINKMGLKKVIDASPTIFRMQSMNAFTSGVLQQLTGLLNLGRSSLFCSGFAATRDHGQYLIKAATGEFEPMIDRRIEEAAPNEVRVLLNEALDRRTSILRGTHYVGYLPGKAGTDYLIYVQGWQELSPMDQDLIKIFFTNVSVGHDNIILNMEIEETQSEVIYTLGEIAEARSKETGNHVRRVAEYSELLALRSGMSEHDAKILRLASPMHDVGKLAIPDSILNKPGRLTPKEWEIMKTHASVGAEMLRHSRRPLMQAAAITAAQHHERWDGGGYPAGLAGTDIHIYGRVTALADVFDALSVRRVYKEAWPMGRVLSYIHEQSGKQFDPDLIRVFQEHFDEMLEILKNYTEPWERGSLT